MKVLLVMKKQDLNQDSIDIRDHWSLCGPILTNRKLTPFKTHFHPHNIRQKRDTCPRLSTEPCPTIH